VASANLEVKVQVWSGWISVDDMLPAHGEEVLVWRAPLAFGWAVDGRGCISALRCTTGGPVWDCDAHWSALRKVSHWMRLPEPPAGLPKMRKWPPRKPSGEQA
jgi:hypothetical protein